MSSPVSAADNDKVTEINVDDMSNRESTSLQVTSDDIVQAAQEPFTPEHTETEKPLVRNPPSPLRESKVTGQGVEVEDTSTPKPRNLEEALAAVKIKKNDDSSESCIENRPADAKEADKDCVGTKSFEESTVSSMDRDDESVLSEASCNLLMKALTTQLCAGKMRIEFH